MLKSFKATSILDVEAWLQIPSTIHMTGAMLNSRKLNISFVNPPCNIYISIRLQQ